MKKKAIALVLTLLVLASGTVYAAQNDSEKDTKTQTSAIEASTAEADAAEESKTEEDQTGAPVAETNITQVVRINIAGAETKLETYSLSTTGWEDFLKRYPGDGCVTISNLEIDRIFTFEEVDPEYPEDVQKFLEKDKPELMGLSTQFNGNNGVFFGDGFYLSYNQSQSYQWTETIEIALETKNESVEFKIDGAINGKKLACSKPKAENGTEFLIFSKDSKLFAINEKMQMFQLIPR